MPKKKFFEKISEDVFLVLLGILMFVLIKMGAKNWNFLIFIIIFFVLLYIFGLLQKIVVKSISLEGDIIEKKAKIFLLIAYWTARILMIYEIFYIF